ncbi:MAG: hypothetical protein ABIQ77_08160 [Anaerolineales bacterium]
MIPSKPTNLPPLAEAVLAAIQDEPWADCLAPIFRPWQLIN